MTKHEFKKLVSVNEKDCWLWNGYVTSGGYGRMYFKGTTQGAHRVAHELFKGPIPVGLEIDHLCRVRNCVNPKHLEAVTKYENMRRGISPASKNLKKTHCPRGHKLDIIYYNDSGRICQRQCSSCVRIYNDNIPRQTNRRVQKSETSRVCNRCKVRYEAKDKTEMAKIFGYRNSLKVSFLHICKDCKKIADRIAGVGRYQREKRNKIRSEG